MEPPPNEPPTVELPAAARKSEFELLFEISERLRSEAKPSRVGNLNGKWAVLFKAQLAVGAFLLPSIMAWATWATVQLFGIKSEIRSFMAVGPRYTATDAHLDQAVLKADILKTTQEEFPPKWLKDELSSISRRIIALEKNQAGPEP